MTHTPGKWHYKQKRELRSLPSFINAPIIEADGKIIAAVIYNSKDEQQANAALIASAPEMLEALKTAVATLNACALYTREGNIYAMPGASQEQKQAEAVINKIEERE